MGLSNELFCESGSFPLPKPPQVFTARSFEALFSYAGTLGCTLCLTPQLFLPVYPHADVRPPTLPAPSHPVLQLLPRHGCSPPWLPVLAPPTSLDENFFFNSLVVRLLYSSVFWHFGCFLFSNLLSSSFGCMRRHSVSTYTSIFKLSIFLAIFPFIFFTHPPATPPFWQPSLFL